MVCIEYILHYWVLKVLFDFLSTLQSTYNHWNQVVTQVVIFQNKVVQMLNDNSNETTELNVHWSLRYLIFCNTLISTVGYHLHFIWPTVVLNNPCKERTVLEVVGGGSAESAVITNYSSWLLHTHKAAEPCVN